MAKTATAVATNTSSEMYLTTEVVTPAQAKQWLSVDNHRNRKIRDGRVAYLSDEIAAGRWQVTHSGIAFDQKGNLLDGQHRLAAIVKAGVAVQMVVARSVAAEAYIAMDRGSMRSIADVLRGDHRAIGVAGAIVRQIQLASYNAGVAPEDVQIVAEALGTEIALANSVRLLRPLARVQLRCGLALRLAQPGAGWTELLMEQWRALNQTDAAKMDVTSAALMRRLLSDAPDRSEVERGRMVTLAWQAFDPTQRTRQQFHLHAGAQREMVTEARRLIRARHTGFAADGSRLERALATTEGL